MSNLFDYLRWRGDLPICRSVPFCPVDSMILARISYLRFDLIALCAREKLGDAMEKLSALPDDAFFNEGDPALVLALRNSPRFSDLILSDYRIRRAAAPAEQFAGIAIHLPQDEIYLSLIGTDNTLVGLREDFDMAYLPCVPSQEDAVKYAQEMLAKYPEANLRLGGHSKGGSAALYAAYHLSDYEQARLIRAESFDGPGFDESLTALPPADCILPKMQSYLPADSIIGRMMTHRETVRIVQSDEKGIGQHSLYSWEVLGGDLVGAEAFESSSDTIHTALSDLLQQCPPEKRRSFFDSLYELIAATSADSSGTLSKSWYKNLPELLSSYKDIPEEERKAALSVFSVLQKSYFSAWKNETAQQFEKMSSALKDVFGFKNES